ncbi:MAG: aldehyde dehydrogenase [Legionellales bacterium RIFCSPHIGHO2_12_FULL_37_14]|nr:MAG: aldehyde dehydrogenase [Legionellales bacterium RIFCSPHIGHO2_12_FULL_37_14]
MDILAQLNLSPISKGAFSGSLALTDAKCKRLVSINPADKTSIGEVLTAKAEDYKTIIKNAKEAAVFWSKTPAPLRGELIRQLGNKLRQIKPQLASLISLEMGKSIVEAEGEVQEMIDMADFAVGQARMLYGKTMHSERYAHRMYEQWHPYGVVGILSAFNFPAAVWAWNACLAIICGNAVIWKPSSKTPFTAIAIHQICMALLEENKYPALFSLFIPESHKVAELMLDDNAIPLISFTGSTNVGKEVALRVARRLGKSLLELGGNNAIIVDETADLNLAHHALTFGAIGTAGQRCTSTRRAFIQEDIFDKLLPRLIASYKAVRIGSPLDKSNHMGPLIDEAAVKQFEHVIAELKKKGANIIYGGKRILREGCFVEPTLVTNVANDWPLVQEETFAPILYLLPFKTINEAIALNNNVPQGLSSALFTQNLHNAELFLSSLGSDCGIANINIGTSGAEIGGAFGGEKETGGGREAGSDSWQAYMRRQTNTINWGKELPLAQGIKFDL